MATQISRSKRTLEAIIISSLLATFIGMFVTIMLLTELRNITGLSFPTLRGLILSLFPLAWFAATVGAYKNWNKIKYYYDGNRLTISQSRSFSGTETVSYGYEKMGSVRLIQTRFGRKHNFGDIVIQLEKEEQPIRLRVIDNPSAHVEAIEKNITEKKVYVADAR